ncbi:hypothetical protein [Sphingobium chungbukense]|nr:hypothetical protein [Sphingobium chungbukense]
MTWKAYAIIPIDWTWEFLPTVQEMAGRFAESDATQRVESVDYDPLYLDNFWKHFELAKRLAAQEGWEGDFRQHPRVFFLPDENQFRYGFVWKQENNGTTFVVSPQPLSWLDGYT